MGISPFIAALDLGTNSFRLLIAQNNDSGLHILHNELQTVRIGENLTPNGPLSPDAITRALAAIKKFAKLISQYHGVSIRACGTAALRNASNADEFINRANSILGHSVEIIDAKAEAMLTFAGSISGFKTLPFPVCLIDSGGGSTELIVATESHTDTRPATISVPVGAVNLTEEFLSPEPSNIQLNRLSEHLHGIIYDALNSLPFSATKEANPNITLIGSGGTATSLAALDLGLVQYDASRIQGHILSRERLLTVHEELIQMPLTARTALPSLAGRRGEIIIAGLMIYLALLEHTGVDKLMVSDAGLLEGILLSIKN